MGWVIYQRDDCHLCDQALAVLAQARVPALESVFIDGDGVLEACYGQRVPVLAAPDGRELDWPFGVDDVDRLRMPVCVAASVPVQEEGALSVRECVVERVASTSTCSETVSPTMVLQAEAPKA